MSTAIGKPVRRREDARFLTGRGRYVDDLSRPGQLHAAFVRSPHAHAVLRSIDLADALRSPAVVAAFDGAALTAAGVGSIPCGWLIHDRAGRPMVEPRHFPLAVDRVRHAGEPVAVVIATSRAAALGAAERVAVEYEPLPASVRAGRVGEPAEAPLWDAAPDNVCCDWAIGDGPAVDAAFAGAAHVTRLALVNNRLVAAPMEPRAAVAEHDPGTGLTVLHTTSQNPHTIRATLANTVLRIPETELRVVSPDVGGGFGTKIFLYPEETVLTWAARRLGRTIRWTSTRSESFLTDVQGRDHETVAELALDAEGTFLALRVTTYANVGAYLSSAATGIPTYYYAPLLSGVYRTPHIHCRVVVGFSNTASVDAYRGAGRPEASYVLERLVDQAAVETGHDRVALRRRNFIRPDQFPYATPLGLTYDSGDHAATLDLVLDSLDWPGFAARQAESRARGLRRGIGLSTYLEIAGATPSRVAAQQGARGGRSEAAQLRVHPGGSVTVFSGSHSHGQGHETTFAQLIAERLGLPMELVRVVQGDTDVVPFGRGTAASRSLIVGGAAILMAVDKVVAKGRRIAAALLEASVDDVVFAEGRFTIAGTDRGLDFAQVARAAYAPAALPPGLEPGLDETAFYEPLNWSFPGGCHGCEVEVDPETGTIRVLRIVAADDLGVIINPMIVHGQIHGGLAQGLGQALLEKGVYEAGGQLLTGSFMDYAMPRAGDMPSFEVMTNGTPCLTNPLQAKGCAEVGSVGLPPAIVNAVLDALRPEGVQDLSMPLTPAHVWAALQGARDNQ